MWSQPGSESSDKPLFPGNELVTLGKLLEIVHLQFPHMQNGKCQLPTSKCYCEEQGKKSNTTCIYRERELQNYTALTRIPLATFRAALSIIIPVFQSRKSKIEILLENGEWCYYSEAVGPAPPCLTLSSGSTMTFASVSHQGCVLGSKPSFIQ